MRTLYLFNVAVHLLAAFLWLGGMIFLAAVGAPVLRGVEPAALRGFGALGQQFRTVGWACTAVLRARPAPSLTSETAPPGVMGIAVGPALAVHPPSLRSDEEPTDPRDRRALPVMSPTGVTPPRRAGRQLPEPS